MNQQNSFVATIDLALSQKIRQDLEDQGFEFSCPAYTIFHAKKKGVSCTLYKSGKFVVQGKDKHDFITYYLEPKILGKFSYSYPHIEANSFPHIGVDEAGKGDLFGPLCIAALYANADQIARLIQMGVRDSKRLKEATVLKLSQQIQKNFTTSLVRISPKRYNELYQKMQNLNTLLGLGHATVIEKIVLKTHCIDVLIDQFASKHVVSSALKKKNLSLNLSQKHHAEQDVVVAGASILARAAFVQELEKISQNYRITLPKGASSQVIRAGKNFVNTYGKDALHMVAKLHFKTINHILC